MPTVRPPAAAILLDIEVPPYAAVADLREAVRRLERLQAEHSRSAAEVRREIADALERYRADLDRAEWKQWFHQPRPGYECWPLFGSSDPLPAPRPPKRRARHPDQPGEPDHQNYAHFVATMRRQYD